MRSLFQHQNDFSTRRNLLQFCKSSAEPLNQLWSQAFGMPAGLAGLEFVARTQDLRSNWMDDKRGSCAWTVYHLLRSRKTVRQCLRNRGKAHPAAPAYRN